MNMRKEVEVKLRVTDVVALRRKLARVKARAAAGGRVHERNILFDTPQGGLAKHGQLLRVRLVEPAGRSGQSNRPRRRLAILTYKGPAVADTSGTVRRGRYKVREELEVGVEDPDRLRLILEALGLRGWFRYEKYRTSYQLPDSVSWAEGLHVELDETPLGVFLELEGSAEAIDRAADLLGYHLSDYITKSYLALHLDHCRRQGLPASDMVFPRAKR